MNLSEFGNQIRKQIQQFIHPDTIIKSPLRQIESEHLTRLNIPLSPGRLRAGQAHQEQIAERHDSIAFFLDEGRGLPLTRPEE